MSATVHTANSYNNPFWHRGFRIWPCVEGDRVIFAWAHDDADLDDQFDQRHGDAPTFDQARADIDDYVDCQEFNAHQRHKATLRSLSDGTSSHG